MEVASASISNSGGREANQDAISEVWMLNKRTYCWALADGLGGHKGGEVAAGLFIRSVTESFVTYEGDPLAGLPAFIERAHQLIQEYQSEADDLREMRTTGVLFAIDGEYAQWAHCGDSRLYVFRSSAVHTQTEDQSVPQTLVKLGQILPSEIRHHEDRNRLTQCLGTPGAQKSLVSEKLKIEPGDAFLLCTDGFWELLLEPEIIIDLCKAISPADWLDLMLDRLRQRIKAGDDNYSAIAVWV